jgi:hypothetical protein
MAKDETEEGITGQPIPKRKLGPAKRHEFEKKRRAARKERNDPRAGDSFSQHRMTGSRGRGSEYQNTRSIREELLSYLLDEGYAETPEAAEKIMVNMSEEWRESIVEESMPPRRSKEERSKRAKELGDRQTIRNVVGKYNKEKPLSKQENPDKYYSNN